VFLHDILTDPCVHAIASWSKHGEGIIMMKEYLKDVERVRVPQRMERIRKGLVCYL
jgi:hypothetical protein